MGIFAQALEYLREFHLASVLVRLVLAALCGGLIGLEREMKRRPAGLRTYIIVCLGAALAMLLGRYAAELSGLLELKTAVDVSRIGAQVINGIGFLGAGTVLLTGRKEVKGLTTAAGLWASACMGLAIGAGMYEGVLIAFVLILLCIRVLPRVENRLLANARNLNLYLEVADAAGIVGVTAFLRERGVEIQDLEFCPGKPSVSGAPSFLIEVRLPRKTEHASLLAALLELDDVRVIEEM